MEKELSKIKELIDTGEVSAAEDKLNSLNIERNETYWFFDATIKQKKQLFGEAINSYQKVVELNPENKEAKIQIEIIKGILSFWNPDLFNP